MGFMKRLWRGEAPWWAAFFVTGLMLFAVGTLAVAINAFLIYKHYAPEAVFNVIWNPLVIVLSLVWWWVNFQTFRRAAKKILPAIALAVVSLNAALIIYGVYYSTVNAQWITGCSQWYDQEPRTVSKATFVQDCVKASKAAANEKSE